jgi:hypothetical protein
MLVEHLPSLEYPPISVCILLFHLYSPYSPVQPHSHYPLLFCRESAGCAGRLLLAGQFGVVRSARPAQLFLFRFGVRAWPSGPGSDWHAQLVHRDLIGRIFGVLTGVCC